MIYGDYHVESVEEVRFACYTTMASHLVLLMVDINY
jgi:hypothetical protein